MTAPPSSHRRSRRPGLSGRVRRALRVVALAALAAAGAPGPVRADPPAAEADDARGDRPARVVRFGALDVTGELRTVRLMFFLDRLRAEFDRPRLPHRSFLPELVEAAGDPEVFE